MSVQQILAYKRQFAVDRSTQELNDTETEELNDVFDGSTNQLLFEEWQSQLCLKVICLYGACVECISLSLLCHI